MTKKLFLFLFASLLLYEYGMAQWISIDIDFEGEGNSNQIELLEIDTSQENNIWQIGEPNKTEFTSAFNEPNAIVTDLQNPYPANNRSSFTVTIKEHYQGFCWGYSLLSFQHKFDTDSLYAGGYIDVSYNGVETWTNIIEDNSYDAEQLINRFYSDIDTIIGGIPAFTGNSNGWIFSQIRWERPLVSYSGLDFIMIRFNFISSGEISDNDGWMIDMFDFDLDDLCVIDVPEIETEETGIKLYPNPIEDISIIELPLIENQNYTIQIHSITGKLINEFNDICDNYVYINRKDYQSGLYIFKIYTKNLLVTTQKFIVR